MTNVVENFDITEDVICELIYYDLAGAVKAVIMWQPSGKLQNIQRLRLTHLGNFVLKYWISPFN